jgi:hypothetical protein
VTELSVGRSRGGAGLVLAVSPGGVFVVGGVVLEAAMQDADESVPQWRAGQRGGCRQWRSKRRRRPGRPVMR